MDSTVDASGVDQSSLEVSALTGTSGGDEREGVSGVTLIASVFCALAIVMAIVMALLFTDLELYGSDDDSGGGDDDQKTPTRYPSGSRSGSPPAMTEAPMETTPSVPVTARRTTSRPLPPPTPARPLTTTTAKRTTRPPRPPTPSSRRTTSRPPPPATPSPVVSTRSPTVPSRRPTTTPITTTTTEITTKSPRPPQSSMKPNSLLCTFGNKTNYGTKFPADGLCDYIFYDSMYKNNKNPLVANWDYDVYSILSKAQKTDKTKTQFGLGFAFEYRRNLTRDLGKSSLEVFWEHNVFHFGILDCPGHATMQAEMDEVFVALKALDDNVQTARASGNTSYIVLGAVSNNDKFNDYFKSKFAGGFTPDLFISVSHQFHADPERSNCDATPPTILTTPPNVSDTHDLYDATRALASIASVPGGPRLSFSVSMKGRWSQLQPSSKFRIFAACRSGTPGPYFGSYTDICTTPPFSSNFLFETLYLAARTFDPDTFRMFVYENEKSLGRKLCFAKSNLTKVEFGVAAYDLDYEDSDNICDDQNSKGAYSRLQIVSIVLKFLVTKFTDRSKLTVCFQLSG